MTTGGAEVVVGGGAVALSGLVLLVGALALAPIAIVLARLVAPGRVVFFARWGVSHVVAAALVGLGAMILLGALVSPLRGLGLAEPVVGLIFGMLVTASVAVAACLFAARLDPTGLRSLGFRAGGNLRAATAGLFAYLLMIPGVIGLGMIWPWLMARLELEYRPQDVALGMFELTGPGLAFAVVAAVIVIPFLEEVVFRGFLQPLLVQNLGDRGGIVATSIAFAALHGISPFLPIFGLSLVLGGVMLRTQRLVAPWLVHAAHNGLMLALLLLVPESRELLGQETRR